MKKSVLTLVVLYCSLTAVIAQNYKKVFYKTQTIENADVKVTISDAVATASGIKFRVTVVNKTTDYIFFKPSECTFKIAGKESKPEEKVLIIRPKEDDFRIVDLKGSQYMVASNYEFILDGIYKVSFIGKDGITAPDFKLPPARNDFKVGGFNVSLAKSGKETAKTDAKFKINYTGDKIGVFEVNKVGMKMPDGKEFANYLEKKPVFYEKGDVDDFIVAWKDIPKASGDMQKVDMLIIWRDAFKEITPEKIAPQYLTILFDEETSNAKGK